MHSGDFLTPSCIAPVKVLKGPAAQPKEACKLRKAIYQPLINCFHIISISVGTCWSSSGLFVGFYS